MDASLFFLFFYAPTWKYARWTPLPPSLPLRITFRNISRWNFDSWHLDSPLFASIVDLGWVLLILLLFWYKLFLWIVVYSQISYSHFVTSHANLKLNDAKIRINWLHNFSNKFELLRIELHTFRYPETYFSSFVFLRKVDDVHVRNVETLNILLGLEFESDQIDFHSSSQPLLSISPHPACPLLLPTSHK